MLMTAGHCGSTGSNTSGPEWREWSFVFSSGDKTKSSQNSGRSEKAFILLTKSQSPHEICGTVQLNRTTSHTGLLIELQGTFTTVNSVNCFNFLLNSIQSTQSQCPNSKVFHRFCGDRKDVPTTSPAFKKYPFTLALSQDIRTILPPTFSRKDIGGVVYSLQVWVQKNGGDWESLGEKVINYFGYLTINPTLHLKSALETEISVEGGLRVLLQLPRKEFLRSENIPFTLKILDPSQGSVKKVSVYLWNMFSCVVREPSEKILSGSKVVDCVIFKRFLKRELVSREGKFSATKISIPTFTGEEGPKLKISYVIQVNLTTKDSRTFSAQQEIIVGTELTSPRPSAPEGQPGLWHLQCCPCFRQVIPQFPLVGRLLFLWKHYHHIMMTFEYWKESFSFLLF